MLTWLAVLFYAGPSAKKREERGGVGVFWLCFCSGDGREGIRLRALSWRAGYVVRRGLVWSPTLISSYSYAVAWGKQVQYALLFYDHVDGCHARPIYRPPETRRWSCTVRRPLT